MLNLLMILLLIHLIGLYIFKPNFNTLNCGIFGHFTNSPKKINQSNVKILGMFNESRGKHSCGLTFDSEIYHGLEKDKLFTDFIKGRTFRASENPLMFGHTRSASVGAAITSHNAHPFGFGVNKKGGYKFIGVHNGTLYNHKELAKQYGIEPKATYKGLTGIDLERDKIDSEILLEILHTDRTYKVLSEYIGKAALVWTDTDAPNVAYFWSGQSRNSESYVAGLEVEERPMNIWIENRNSFYFSSMPESLEAIGAPLADIFQIEYNTVYQVTNGDFKHALQTKVSRKQCWQTETYVHKAHNYNHSGFNSGKSLGGSENDYANEMGCDWEDHRMRFPKVTPGATATLNSKDSINIYNDKPILEQNEYKDKVYSYKLRYWRRGHLINGIYCHIPDYGFYELGTTPTYARLIYDGNKGLRFFNGQFQKDTTILTGYIPFPKEQITPIFYYFLDGVMLKTLLDYEALKDQTPLIKDTLKFSHVSRHPIINLGFTYKINEGQEIYKDGMLFTGTITEIGFEKVYHIVQGNLMKTVIKSNSFPKPNLNKAVNSTPIELPLVTETATVEVATTPKIEKHNPEILKKSLENIMRIEETIKAEEVLDEMSSKTLDEDEIISTKITEMIDSELTPCLMSFQTCRDELELMPAQNETVIEAKSLIKDLIQTINKFVN